MPLFHVFFRGTCQSGRLDPLVKFACLVSILSFMTKKLKASANKQEEREVEGSRKTRILTRFTENR